ncbi:MAG: peptidylprolyl isomerase [Desulfobulbus sp.]|nr:MAG: peptidylprolyl isomerase [Desulfobulbus sp.]
MKISAFLFALFFSLPVLARADMVDRVVAIVNDEVITLSEVNEEGKAVLQRVAENVPASQLEDALQEARKTVIEKMIEKKIMLQEAEKANISVSDEEVQMALDRILERNATSTEQLQEEIARLGMTEAQFRENLKQQVLSSKLVNLEIRSKVIIPEDKIIDYYDTHYTERVEEGGYYLLQIGIGLSGGSASGTDGAAGKEAARKKAEEIRAMAVAGKDFKALAQEYSDLPSAADGGDIGVLRKEEMPGAMYEVISRTPPGQLTEIIETGAGYQFFKVLSGQEGQILTKVPYESVKDDIYDTLYQQEMEGRFAEWLKNKKSLSYIKIL